MFMKHKKHKILPLQHMLLNTRKTNRLRCTVKQANFRYGATIRSCKLTMKSH